MDFFCHFYQVGSYPEIYDRGEQSKVLCFFSLLKIINLKFSGGPERKSPGKIL